MKIKATLFFFLLFPFYLVHAQERTDFFLRDFVNGKTKNFSDAKFLMVSNQSELEYLEKNFKKFKNLNSLDLDEVSYIPTFIFDNKSIISLGIGNANIDEIPAEISNLTNLKELVVIRNRKSFKIPKSIKECTKLHTIKILDSGLELLPDEIGSLDSLKVLNLEDNRLSSINNALFDLPKIELINLNNNEFIGLPEGNWKESNKIRLNFEGNRFTEADIEKLNNSTPSLYRVEMHKDILFNNMLYSNAMVVGERDEVLKKIKFRPGLELNRKYVGINNWFNYILKGGLVTYEFKDGKVISTTSKDKYRLDLKKYIADFKGTNIIKVTIPLYTGLTTVYFPCKGIEEFMKEDDSDLKIILGGSRDFFTTMDAIKANPVKVKKVFFENEAITNADIEYIKANCPNLSIMSILFYGKVNIDLNKLSFVNTLAVYLRNIESVPESFNNIKNIYLLDIAFPQSLDNYKEILTGFVKNDKITHLGLTYYEGYSDELTNEINVWLRNETGKYIYRIYKHTGK